VGQSRCRCRWRCFLRDTGSSPMFAFLAGGEGCLGVAGGLGAGGVRSGGGCLSAWLLGRCGGQCLYHTYREWGYFFWGRRNIRVMSCGYAVLFLEVVCLCTVRLVEKSGLVLW